MKKTRVLAIMLLLLTMLSSCELYMDKIEPRPSFILKNVFKSSAIWVVICQHKIQNRGDSLTAYYRGYYGRLEERAERFTEGYDSIFEVTNNGNLNCHFWYGDIRTSWREHFQISQIDSLCILTFNSRNDASEWIRMRNDSLLNKKFSYSLSDIDAEYYWTIELKSKNESE